MTQPKFDINAHMDDRLSNLTDLAAELGAVPVSAKDFNVETYFAKVATKTESAPIVIDIDRTLELMQNS